MTPKGSGELAEARSSGSNNAGSPSFVSATSNACKGQSRNNNMKRLSGQKHRTPWQGRNLTVWLKTKLEEMTHQFVVLINIIFGEGTEISERKMQKMERQQKPVMTRTYAQKHELLEKGRLIKYLKLDESCVHKSASTLHVHEG